MFYDLLDMIYRNPMSFFSSNVHFRIENDKKVGLHLSCFSPSCLYCFFSLPQKADFLEYIVHGSSSYCMYMCIVMMVFCSGEKEDAPPCQEGVWGSRQMGEEYKQPRLLGGSLNHRWGGGTTCGEMDVSHQPHPGRAPWPLRHLPQLFARKTQRWRTQEEMATIW